MIDNSVMIKKKKKESIMKPVPCACMIMLCYAQCDNKDRYAIGKNRALPRSMRTLHIARQAIMADAQMRYWVKQALAELTLCAEVQKDLHRRRSGEIKKISWHQLEERSQASGGSFLLMGFGSLLHKDFSYPSTIYMPGLVCGVKRIYNLKHHNPAAAGIGLPTHGYEREDLRLNTILTNNQYDITNGLLIQFEIGSPAYQDLKNRERKYDLLPVKVILYASLFIKRPLCVDAYVLSGDVGYQGLGYEPHVVYNSIVMDGVEDIQQQGNPDFLPLFLDTTYLSDGQTTIREWIKDKAHDL